MSKPLDLLILEQKRQDKIEDQLFMENSYKELLQHCFLFALNQVGFFSHAAFHGGTCLRIIDKIDRFSEDLDFIQINSNASADELADLMISAAKHLKNLGLELEVTHNNINNNIQKIWIKERRLAKQFLSNNPKYAIQGAKSKIKVEIDNDHPQGSTLVESLLDFPEQFKVLTQVIVLPFLVNFMLFCVEVFLWEKQHILKEEISLI